MNKEKMIGLSGLYGPVYVFPGAVSAIDPHSQYRCTLILSDGHVVPLAVSSKEAYRLLYETQNKEVVQEDETRRPTCDTRISDWYWYDREPW